MTKQQVLQYFQRWDRIKDFQDREMRMMSMPLKFKQLCFLMDSFREPSRTSARQKEIEKTRKNWLVLKKNA